MTNTVTEERKRLHAIVKAGDVIDVEDIRRVNTFSRIEKIKTETRNLMQWVAGLHETVRPKYEKEVDVFDILAIDWVYSDELDWENSLAAKHLAKIQLPGGPNDVF